MDNTATSQKLEVIETIKDGINIGIQNIGAILVNTLLWVLTVWIPYLNVGTTIGLTVGIVAKASRGELIPMTEIFDPKYRKCMGEYFLVVGLVGLGVSFGMAFLFIPGIVISLAWSLAILLVIDKEKNPVEAITLSNNCTYGYKWRMVGIYLLTGLCVVVAISILTAIGAVVGSGVMIIISLLIILISFFWMIILIGLQASIYRQLTEGI
jgi:hypothetical protein